MRLLDLVPQKEHRHLLARTFPLEPRQSPTGMGNAWTDSSGYCAAGRLCEAVAIGRDKPPSRNPTPSPYAARNAILAAVHDELGASLSRLTLAALEGELLALVRDNDRGEFAAPGAFAARLRRDIPDPDPAMAALWGLAGDDPPPDVR